MTFRTFLTAPIDPNHVGTPFYLDMLRELGVDIHAITIDDYLYRDEELSELCLDIADGALVDTILADAETLLPQYPANAMLLQSIAEPGATDSASLRASLAMHELSVFLLRQERNVPLDTETRIRLSYIGAEILFQYLLWLDLSDKVFPLLLEKVKLVPESRDILMTMLFRTAAVCDITDDEDDGGSFYQVLRSIYAKIFVNDPFIMWELHLADTVRTFIFDGPDAEGMDSMIAHLTAAPLKEEQYYSIDRYLDVEPMLEELFDRFHLPPTEPLPSNPAKDLHRLIARQNFSSPEEVSDFVAQFMNTPIPEIPEEELTDDERAEDAVEAILHAGPDNIHDRLLALTVTYPSSLWPWLGLSRISETATDSLIYAEKGLALAHETSTDQHAKSYVELLDCKAYALMHESRYAEAIESFEQLISIEEHRQITNGEALLALLLRRGQRQHLERADQIITALQAEGSEYLPALPWLVLLHRMITKRDSSVINVTVADAMNTHPYVGLIITGLHADQTSYHIPRIETADEDATIHAITLAQICWPVYPEAVKKLKKMLTHPDGLL